MAARKPRRHAGEHDLIAALGQPGCPVCRLASEAVDAFLQSVCYEQVNDLDLRAELRAAGGFCRADAHRFLTQRHGQLATAIVYRDVLVNAARRLEHAHAGGTSRLASLLGGRGTRRVPVTGEPGRCPGCRVRGESERRHLALLRTRVTEPQIQASYRAADGLCLPHLERAIAAADAGARVLAAAAADNLGTLVGALDDYIAKHDYRFRPERWDPADSPIPARAVERAVGGEEPLER